MLRVELIVTDLDGTFTLNKYEFCQENADAVRIAQKNGIRVCACTARNWGLAKGQVRRAGFDGYTVACNGASIVDNESGLPIYRAKLMPEDVEILLTLGVEHNVCVAVYTNEQILVLDGHMARHYAFFPGDWETVERDLAIPVTRCRSILEMAVLGGESAELVEFIKPGGVLLSGEEKTLLQRFCVSGMGGPCAFIMKHGVSKLDGVQRLAELLNISRENIMAVGDSGNDADMLRWAGVGVAVGNADKGAQIAADFITKPHDEAGFAHAVMDIALSGRTIKQNGEETCDPSN